MNPTRRVALVTGAGQGIGRAIARRLLERGMIVTIAESDAAAGAEAEQALRAFGPAHFIETDVADEQAVRACVAEALDRFGRLDALVNNAAISDPDNGPVAALSLETWNRVIGVNLTGCFLCAREAAPHLRRAHGAIVNIASTRALQSEPDTEAYAAAKGGLVALTHALAISLGPEVRVNCISPGWIDVSGSHEGGAERAAALTERDHAQHPVGRVGRPGDVASLVAYLLLDEPGFVTGQNLVVDGGMTRKMIYRED